MKRRRYSARLNEDFIQQALVEQAPDEPYNCAIRVRYIFYLQRPKSIKRKHASTGQILTDMEKAIEEAANGLLWKTPSRIVSKAVYKEYADDCRPRIIISIEKA